MKRRLTILALTALAVVALFSVVLTVTPLAHAGGPPDHARGATQIRGIGVLATDCEFPEDLEVPDNIGIVPPLKFTEDLDGCWYTFVKTAKCSPSGAYNETGIDIFVGEYNGEAGTFETTYRFTAKFEDCNVPPEELVEIFGRCQHPIEADKGTGIFEGVAGRIDIKDDLEAGEFLYRGHLK